MKPFLKCIGIAGVTLLLLFLPKMDINAEKSASIVSSRTTDEDIYIYIQGVSDIISGTKVQIGNSMCENIKAANISSTGYEIKTTILFDNSVSLSNKWGNEAKNFMKELVSNCMDKEQFRIATFAKELNVVTDYSSDYEAVLRQIDEIAYINQDSYLTDVLYGLLLEDDENQEANFTRLIIIADGADDQEIKYTQTELAELIKESGVVVHTIGVKAAKNNQPIETLFSYSRYSGGTYTLVESEEKMEVDNTGINNDYKLFCLKITPDTILADGSNRNVKLMLNTSEGETVVTGSVRMPFATIDVDDTQKEPVIAEENKVPEVKEEVKLPVIEENVSDLPIIDVQQHIQQKEVKTKNSSILIYGLIGGTVLLIVAWVVVLILILKRRQKKIDVVITNNTNSSVMENKTVRIYGESEHNPDRKYVVLTDIANSRRTFKAPIGTRVVIGRGTGDIMLSFDSTVSYAHCEILKKGSLYYINDLKSSNGTFYEDMRIYSETPIINGSIVKIGACKYRFSIEE